MEKNFETLKELYEYIKPALYSKKKELKLLGIEYIKEEDIWNYLTEKCWGSKKDLTILDMVDDIMDVNKDEMESYLVSLFKNSNRNLIIKEENLL